MRAASTNRRIRALAVVFGLLYLSLTILNFVLLRRYARVDPPHVGGEGDEFAVPAATY